MRSFTCLTIFALMVVIGCAQQHSGPPKRHLGFAKVVQVTKIKNNILNVSYAIHNGTERNWCLHDPKNSEFVTNIIFKSAINGLEIELHSADDFGPLPGEVRPATQLMVLSPGQEVTFTAQIDIRYFILDEFVSQSVRAVVEVDQLVVFCDKLKNGNIKPYDFRYKFSTDTLDGNSLILSSRPSEEFIIPNLSKP